MPSAPLRKLLVLQVKRRGKEETESKLWARLVITLWLAFSSKSRAPTVSSKMPR
jgi:hypothetical protein